MTKFRAGSNPISMCYPCVHPPKEVLRGMKVPLCLYKNIGIWVLGRCRECTRAEPKQKASKVRQGVLQRAGRQLFSCTEPLWIPESTSGQLREPTSFFWTWLFVKTIGYSACMDFKGRTPNVIWPRQLRPFIASIFLRYCCQGLKCLHAPWF